MPHFFRPVRTDETVKEINYVGKLRNNSQTAYSSFTKFCTPIYKSMWDIFCIYILYDIFIFYIHILYFIVYILYLYFLFIFSISFHILWFLVFRLHDSTNIGLIMWRTQLLAQRKSSITQKLLTVASPNFVHKFIGQFCTNLWKWSLTSEVKMKSLKGSNS